MSNVKSITPNESADFTPELGNYKTLQPFRYWCQKVLPLVYDDSLSYYELLCKVVDYLNKTMEDVETLHGDVTNLHKAYVELQSYVNNYFSTLDVQEEINNKLDKMSENGELTKLISPLLPSLISDWLSKNITPTTPPIDKTLSVSGSGADAKIVGERLLKNGFSYGYQYEKMRNYRGTFDNTVYDVNGSCIMNGENYSKATLGTSLVLIGFGYKLLNAISLPKNDTYTVYYLLDLRNTVKKGNMSFSLWLTDSEMNWTDEHVVYGGSIKANFGELNILSATIKKGSSNLNVSNVLLRVDNISSVPENMDFSFILFTNDFVYNLVSHKTTKICFWGDSLTAGAGGEGTTFPKICCNELGISNYLNCGVGGETANTIACRQGGNSLILPPGKVNKYTLSQFTDIFGHACNPLRQGNGSNSVNPITINGVECELAISQTSATDPSATYTITGYTDELLAETPVKFNGCNYTSDVTVIFVGQNGPDFDERLKIIDSMISKINEKYIVMGLSSGSKETMKEEESQMLNKYGVHFFNTRNMLSKYGMSIMKIRPTSTDVEEMNVGKVPTSLHSDSVHLNAKGYTALGKLLAQKIRACGYI